MKVLYPHPTKVGVSVLVEDPVGRMIRSHRLMEEVKENTPDASVQFKRKGNKN